MLHIWNFLCWMSLRSVGALTGWGRLYDPQSYKIKVLSASRSRKY